VLGAGKTVVLVEEVASVDAVGLLAARLDDSDTTTRDVLESEVETARLRADDEEHAVEGLGVLNLGEEVGVETEAQGDLGGGEVVGLEDGVVEDTESSKNHLVVLVVNVLGDLVLEGIIGEDLDGEARGHNLHGILLVLNKVVVGERSVESANETGIVLNNLVDVVRGEGLRTETALQVGEESLLSVVLNIQKLGERGVLRTQSVEEVLDENPSGVGVDGLLEAELSVKEEVVELVVGETVEERDLLGDLVDRLIPRGELLTGLGGLSGRSKVDTHDGDTVGELLEVLSGGGDTVVVVKITEGREKTLGSAGSESKNHSLLVGALDVEDLDDRTGSVHSELDDILVDLLGVGGGLLEETMVGDEFEVGLLGISLLRGSSKSALVDEVASEGGLGLGAQESGRSESLNTVLAGTGVVDVLGLKALLVARTSDVGTASNTGVDVDGVVASLHIQTDLLLLVLASEGSNLGGVERGDVAGDDIRGLKLEVDIIDAKVLVEPLNLLINLGLRDEASSSDQRLDSLLLLRLASELRGDVANGSRSQNAVTVTTVSILQRNGEVSGLGRRTTAGLSGLDVGHGVGGVSSHVG